MQRVAFSDYVCCSLTLNHVHQDGDEFVTNLTCVAAELCLAKLQLAFMHTHAAS